MRLRILLHNIYGKRDEEVHEMKRGKVRKNQNTGTRISF